MLLVARLSLVAAVLSGAVLVLLPTMSFAADTHRVAVVDDAYDDGNRDGNDTPATTAITAGDTVVWRWHDGNENSHTVTSRADAPMPFDSDADCGEDETACREAGNRFAVTFDDPGTYDYYCKVHADPTGLTGMTGTIEVQPAPEPSGSDSGSSEPSSEESSQPPPSEEEEPSSEPEPSESPSPQEEPNPEPTSESASEPQDDPADDGDRPPRQADAPGVGVQDEPTDRRMRGLDPQVAPDAAEGSTFSPFPSAPDLPSESETADMAVSIPSRGGGPSRGAVVGVAIASVIGSAGAFGKIVLFGQPWG